MSLLRKSQQRDPNYTNRYETYRFIRNPFPRNPGVVLNSEDVRENGEIFILMNLIWLNGILLGSHSLMIVQRFYASLTLPNQYSLPYTLELHKIK